MFLWFANIAGLSIWNRTLWFWVSVISASLASIVALLSRRNLAKDLWL